MTEFLTADTSLPPYMVFPRFLLDTELNETTKLLYVILLDRARLSLKNEGWTDASGHVFIYFTIEAMAKVMQKSQMTIKTSLTSLEKSELILRKRQGVGQPNRIYVKFPLGTFHHTDKILSDQELEEIKHSVSNWKEYIERLSGYMASTGKQYRNHAATIINWSRQDNPPSQQRIYESEEYETL